MIINLIQTRSIIFTLLIFLLIFRPCPSFITTRVNFDVDYPPTKTIRWYISSENIHSRNLWFIYFFASFEQTKRVSTSSADSFPDVDIHTNYLFVTLTVSVFDPILHTILHTTTTHITGLYNIHPFNGRSAWTIVVGGGYCAKERWF